MKQIQTIEKGTDFNAVNFGNLDGIKDYVLELGPEIKIPGKVFGGQAVGATGSEFSFQVFAPGQETGFLHTHKNHEELYFFLKAKESFRSTEKCSPLKKAPLSVWPLTVVAVCATMALSLW